jgi:acetylornithine deacetylase/succinyl-diaminopimelate desuccinylase-like protein
LKHKRDYRRETQRREASEDLVPSPEILSAWRYSENNKQKFVDDLLKLVRQPSISAQGVGLEDCAEMVRSMMSSLGMKTTLMPIAGAPDIVCGVLEGDKNAKTLLIYNHYDVQPPDPLDEWKSDPFDPVVRDDRIYGRGAGDDKGELVARLKALESLINSGTVPKINLKWIVEGEEETGSHHLHKFVTSNRELLRSDACLWEGGEISPRGTPEIHLGVKGLLYVEFRLKVGEKDQHSSYAPVAPNPAWRLVDLLKSIKDEKEKILIDGFYDDAIAPSAEEKKLLWTNEFSSSELRKALKVDYLLGQTKDRNDIETITRLLYSPTANIAGFGSGYLGEGSKTIVPRQAFVKMDFRLVPNMRSKDILAKLKRHLKKNGFSDVKIIVHSGEDPAKTPISSNIARVLYDCSRMVYNKPPNVWPTIAGTGPLSLFVNTLGIETAMGVGVSYPGSSFHAPNEHILLEHYHNAVKELICLFTNF